MFDARLQVLALLITAPLILSAMRSDWRYRRLPNSLTVAIAVVGLALNTLFGGLSGLGMAFLGMLIGLAIVFPFHLFGMVGAGDLKFLGALGAYLGSPGVLYAAAIGVIAAGVCSGVLLVIGRRTIPAGRWSLILTKLTCPQALMDSDFASYKSLQPRAHTIPYGVYLGTAAIATSLYQIYISAGGV